MYYIPNSKKSFSNLSAELEYINITYIGKIIILDFKNKKNREICKFPITTYEVHNYVAQKNIIMVNL